MSARRYVGSFTSEESILAATREARAAGFTIEDVYAPYAVHGIDEAMGLRASRLTWVCFCAGTFGLLFGLGFQYYTSVISWPLNVGGKPFNSFPAFIPIGFELTVLCAGLTTVAALLLRCGLLPGKPGRALPRVTNDRFSLVLHAADEGFDEAKAKALCQRLGAVEVGYVDA